MSSGKQIRHHELAYDVKKVLIINYEKRGLTLRILIVGAGLFGSVFAYEAAKLGHEIDVIEKRNHIGGNIYTKEMAGIQVHQYGAHIFHTNDQKIWDYMNQFAPFNRYTNCPVANYKGEIYNLPFNMNTFNKLWGVVTPEEAKKKIEEQKVTCNVSRPTNLEQQAISLVGVDVYEKLIKGYTEKQWGREAENLPAFIIKRLPVRYTYDNNYFDDKYQGIPIGGYTQIIEKMLSHDNIQVFLEVDFFEQQQKYLDDYDKVVYSGMIDQFFDYEYGVLEYRSLRFETEVLPIANYQGNAVVNYTDAETPFTRIIEHKHFEFGTQPHTVVTREYPTHWSKGDEPYYPMNDRKNNALYMKYKQLAENYPDVIFGGRLGLYKYFDMHQVIAAALVAVKSELQESPVRSN